jgi:dTDP-4-amino-4,6-dideoxygalactose transaminase
MMASNPTMSRSVPFFNYPHVFMPHKEELLTRITDICSKGSFILQQDLENFESNLAKYLGAKYAIGVANGTDALVIALKAADIGEGDEVIFASHTYVATAAAIHFAGAIPVPVECGFDHLIDPESIKAAITSKTKAIMPTQLNGRTCNMDVLQAIADEHGLLIVEDAAQGMGAKFKGKCAATFGVAGTISFYPAKTLGCFGDGGAVITNDDEMYEKLWMLHDHGRDRDGLVRMWGYNTRLDNLQASILDFKLTHYDEEVARRREIASMYQERLGDLSELQLPPAPNSDPDHFDVYQNYEFQAERRDDLKTYLRENGIGTIIQWAGKPVHQFEGLGIHATLPVTDRFFTRCLMLPMNTSLSNDDVEYVSDKVRKFYQQS